MKKRVVLTKGNRIRAARVLLVRCAVENLSLFAFWWHFGSQSLVWSAVVCFQVKCSPISCSADGPLARASKRHRGANPMMAGIKRPCLVRRFASPVPTHVDIVLMDR